MSTGDEVPFDSKLIGGASWAMTAYWIVGGVSFVFPPDSFLSKPGPLAIATAVAFGLGYYRMGTTGLGRSAAAVRRRLRFTSALVAGSILYPLVIWWDSLDPSIYGPIMVGVLLTGAAAFSYGSRLMSRFLDGESPVMRRFRMSIKSTPFGGSILSSLPIQTVFGGGVVWTLLYVFMKAYQYNSRLDVYGMAGFGHLREIFNMASSGDLSELLIPFGLGVAWTQWRAWSGANVRRLNGDRMRLLSVGYVGILALALHNGLRSTIYVPSEFNFIPFFYVMILLVFLPLYCYSTRFSRADETEAAAATFWIQTWKRAHTGTISLITVVRRMVGRLPIETENRGRKIENRAPRLTKGSYILWENPRVAIIGPVIVFGYICSLFVVNGVLQTILANTDGYSYLTAFYALELSEIHISAVAAYILTMPSLVGGGYAVVHQATDAEINGSKVGFSGVGDVLKTYTQGATRPFVTHQLTQLLRVLLVVLTAILLAGLLLSGFTAAQYAGYLLTDGWQFLDYPTTILISAMLGLVSLLISIGAWRLSGPAVVVDDAGPVASCKRTVAGFVSQPKVTAVSAIIYVVSLAPIILCVAALIFLFETTPEYYMQEAKLALFLGTPAIAALLIPHMVIYSVVSYKSVTSELHDGAGRWEKKSIKISNLPVRNASRVGFAVLLVLGIAIGGPVIRWTDHRPAYDVSGEPTGPSESPQELLRVADDQLERESFTLKTKEYKLNTSYNEPNTSELFMVKTDYQDRQLVGVSYTHDHRYKDSHYVGESIAAYYVRGNSSPNFNIPEGKWRAANHFPLFDRRIGLLVEPNLDWKVTNRTNGTVTLRVQDPRSSEYFREDPNWWPHTEINEEVRLLGENYIQASLNSSSGRVQRIRIRRGYEVYNTSNNKTVKTSRQLVIMSYKYGNVDVKRPDITYRSWHQPIADHLLRVAYY